MNEELIDENRHTQPSHLSAAFVLSTFWRNVEEEKVIIHLNYDCNIYLTYLLLDFSVNLPLWTLFSLRLSGRLQSVLDLQPNRRCNGMNGILSSRK